MGKSTAVLQWFLLAHCGLRICGCQCETMERAIAISEEDSSASPPISTEEGLSSNQGEDYFKGSLSVHTAL